MVSTSASQQEGSGFEPSLSQAFLCGVCMFSLYLCGFPPGILVSFHHKDMHATRTTVENELTGSFTEMLINVHCPNQNK